MQIIKKKPGDWSPENIADFWNWNSIHPSGSALYFTAVMAPGIARFLQQKKMLTGKLLDYGCGSGHLLAVLAEQGRVECYGLDFSIDSVAAAKEKTQGLPGIRQVELVNGLPTGFASGLFSTITLIETIEHLQDDLLDATLQEIYRLLEPGGKLFITTPFNEDLEKHMSFCPFCRSEFHHMQHMQSFTVERLVQLMKDHGLAVDQCRNTDIEMLRLGKLKYALKMSMASFAEALGLKEKRKDKTPNLLAIFTKPV